MQLPVHEVEQNPVQLDAQPVSLEVKSVLDSNNVIFASSISSFSISEPILTSLGNSLGFIAFVGIFILL